MEVWGFWATVVASLVGVATFVYVVVDHQRGEREAKDRRATDSQAAKVSAATLGAVQHIDTVTALTAVVAESLRRGANEQEAASEKAAEVRRARELAAFDAEVRFRVGRWLDTLNAIGIRPTTTFRRWTEGEYRRMNSALRTFVGRREDSNDWVRSQTTWLLMEGIRERDNDASVVGALWTLGGITSGTDHGQVMGVSYNVPESKPDTPTVGFETPHVEVLSRRPLYEVVREIAIDRWAGPATRRSQPGVSAADAGGSR